MSCNGPCNSCQEELFITLGWSVWLPQAYGINAIVINPGNSNLYVSLEDNNTTIPAQPGASWALTTVAQLIAITNGTTLRWPTWFSGGGTGPNGDYMMNFAVNYNGQNYISLVDNNVDNPEGSINWQRFAMNEPGE